MEKSDKIFKWPGGAEAGHSGLLMAVLNLWLDSMIRVIKGGVGRIRSSRSHGLFCCLEFKSPHLESGRFVSEAGWERHWIWESEANCILGSNRQGKFPLSVSFTCKCG